MEWQHKGGKVLNCKSVGLDGKLGGISSVCGGDGIPKELWLPHPWSVQGEAGAMWDSEGVPVHGVHTKPCRAPHTEGFDAFNNLFCSLKSFMFENSFPPPGPMFNIVLQNWLKHQQHLELPRNFPAQGEEQTQQLCAFSLNIQPIFSFLVSLGSLSLIIEGSTPPPQSLLV